jgi:lysophospholipase L1-like esterase
MKKSGRLRKWSFALAAFLLSGIVLLILVEVGLRIAASMIKTPIIEQALTPPKESPTSVEIFCVGDSHVWGKGAEDRKFSYPAQLEGILRTANPDIGWYVNNAGVPGNNSSQALALVRQRLAKKPFPKLVLMTAGTNNDHNLTQATFLPKELKTEAPYRQWQYLFRNSRTFRLGQVTAQRIGDLLEGKEKVPDVMFEEVVQDVEPFMVAWIKNDYEVARLACRKAGCKFALVGYAINDANAYAAMQEAAIEGVPFLDNLKFGMPILSRRMDLMAPDKHPNAKGYGLIASRVAGFLAQEKLAPVTEAQVDSALKELGF